MARQAKSSSGTEWLLVKRTGGTGGLTQVQRQTLRGLGLSKNQRVNCLVDTNAARGMVNKVIHWVKVEIISGKKPEFKKKAQSKGYRVVSKGA